MKLERKALATGLLLSFCALSGRAEAADPLALGAGDRIAVSVLGQQDLSGEYDVPTDGAVSFHLLGAVDVDGLTTQEVERNIAEMLSARFKSDASVTVSVVRHRPIYVLGDVRAPGAYPFAYDLTVAKAVALAGGFLRPSNEAGLDARLVEEIGALGSLEAQIQRARDRLAVLDAEFARLDGATASSSGLEDAESTGLAAELLRTRRSVVELEADRASRQEQLALQEAASFDARGTLIKRQLQATEAALALIEGLPGQSVARREQMVERQIMADRFRADELEVTAYAAQARQSADAAAAAGELARVRHRSELIEDQIEAEADLFALQGRIDGVLALIRLHGAAAASIAAAAPLSEDVEVMRMVDGIHRWSPSSLDAALRPGDVVRIGLVRR